MGVCEGVPNSILPDHLGRADYHGASVNQAARFMDAGWFCEATAVLFCNSALALTERKPPLTPLQLLTVDRLHARSTLPSLSLASGRSPSLLCSRSKGKRQKMIMTALQVAKLMGDWSNRAMWKALPCQPCLPLPFCHTCRAMTASRSS